MSLLQDKKFIIHVSCEIIILGSMVYFFNNKTKQLLAKVTQNEKDIEELKTELSVLKKQNEPNLNEMRFLLNAMEESKKDAKNILSQLKQSKQYQSQRSQPPQPPQPPPPPKPHPKPIEEEEEEEKEPKRVRINENVQVFSFEPKKTGVQIEVIDELDKELEDELNELVTE